VAENAVNLIFEKLGRKGPPSRTAITPIHGGNIEQFDSFVEHALRQRRSDLGHDVVRALVHNYGSEYQSVLRYLDEDSKWGETLGGTTVLKAEVVHAAREEMAERLTDVVFRRTALGTGGNPGESTLRSCAELMGSVLGWDQGRISRELTAVKAAFPLG
jgi:glycerol-3-phosphate dehydrogenase